MKKKSNRVTSEETKKIVNLLKEKKNIKEIAELLKKSTQTIRNVAKKHGMKPPY